MTKKVLVPKKRGRPAKVSTLTNPTLSAMTCVDLMTQALMSRREALRTEVSVALGVFYEAGRTSNEAKEILYQVYCRIGYDCIPWDRPDYKTINRRINNAALLFDKIGYDKLKNWIGKSTEYELIGKVREQIVELGIESMDSLLSYCGKTSRKLPGLVVGDDGFVSDQKDSSADRFRIDTPRIHWVAPKEATPQDLMEFAARIMAVAKEMEMNQRKSIPQKNPAIEEAVRMAQAEQLRLHGPDEPVGEVQKDRGIVPENFKVVH